MDKSSDDVPSEGSASAELDETTVSVKNTGYSQEARHAREETPAPHSPPLRPRSPPHSRSGFGRESDAWATEDTFSSSDARATGQHRSQTSVFTPNLPGHGITTYGRLPGHSGMETDDRPDDIAHPLASAHYRHQRMFLKTQARDTIEDHYDGNPFFRRVANIVRDIHRKRNS